MTQHGGDPSQPSHEDDEPVDLGWLVEAEDAVGEDPAISAATSSPPLPSDRVSHQQVTPSLFIFVIILSLITLTCVYSPLG